MIRVTMHTLIASHTTVALMLLVALAACSAQAPTASPTSASPTATPGSSSTITPSSLPTQAPAADCVNPPLDITSLINVADPVACYGDAPLTLDATWTGGGVADCPAAPEPGWLACSAYALQPFGDTRKTGAPELFVALDPSVSVSLAAPFPQVRVTGHFDDPAALTCHETQLGAGAGTLAPVADTIQACRKVFVLTQVVPIQA